MNDVDIFAGRQVAGLRGRSRSGTARAAGADCESRNFVECKVQGGRVEVVGSEVCRMQSSASAALQHAGELGFPPRERHVELQKDLGDQG